MGGSWTALGDLPSPLPSAGNQRFEGEVTRILSSAGFPFLPERGGRRCSASQQAEWGGLLAESEGDHMKVSAAAASESAVCWATSLAFRSVLLDRDRWSVESSRGREGGATQPTPLWRMRRTFRRETDSSPSGFPWWGWSRATLETGSPERGRRGKREASMSPFLL